MENRTLSFSDAPRDYALCFNNDCALHDKCMHYRMGQLAPDTKTSGNAVYPSALKDGMCLHFAETEPVRFAWGFNGLYTNLPKDMVSRARKALREYLGNGASAYYRYHNGERLLSPARQKEIIDFIGSFGSTEGLEFDNYVLQYDFT